MRTRPVLLFLGLALVTTPARLAAADAVDPGALSLAKSFAKICILAVPDFNTVMLKARLEDWKQVEGPKRDTMVEFKGPSTRSTWVTKGVDDLPIAVTVARKPGQLVRDMAATCAIQTPDVAPAAAADALAAILPLPEPEKPVVDGERTTTAWSLYWGNRTVTVVMVAHTANKPGVILNAVIQQNVR